MPAPASAAQNRTGAPTAFKTTGIPLPAAAGSLSSTRPYPVAVSGYTVFVSLGTSSEVIDAATGETTGVVKVQNAIAQNSNAAGTNPEAAGDTGTAPVIIDQQGQQVAIFGYSVTLPGHGTTPSSLAVELDAVTTSGTLLWSMTTPTRTQPSLLEETPLVTFVGVSGDDAIATIGDDEDGYSTYAIDIASRTIAWVNAQFLAQAVIGGTVVGTYDTSTPSSNGGALGDEDTANLDTLHVEAVSAATGKTIWQQAESVTGADIQQAGPSTIMTEAVDSSSRNDTIWLLHLSTGKGSELANYPQQGVTDFTPPWTCEFDSGTVVVCSLTLGQQVFAVNGTTGDSPWQLPPKSGNRVAPKVTAVFDGDIYGSTQSGPVVLNAVTGADVNDSPGAAPVVLDSDLGIAQNGNYLEAYLAAN